MSNSVTETVRYYIVNNTTGQQINTDCNGVPLNSTVLTKEYIDKQDKQTELKNEFALLFFSNNISESTCLEWITKNRNVFVELVNSKIDGETALHNASMRGYTDVVKCLINDGVNVNELDGHTGRTALHNASMCGRTEIVKLLIDAGVNINIVDYDCRYAINLALYYKHMDIVELLINTCCD